MDETAARLGEMTTYRDFARKIETVRHEFLAFLETAQREGKRVLAYGAAAKGVVFLNFCGIDQRGIELVADRNEYKQGKRLPGSHVRIVSPEELLAERPDYIVILPWNLKDEIMQQLAGIRSWGGKFVTAIPKLQIHS
jgi:ABC-type Fe3+-hydroxamate transport system substrate-binding protein